MVWISRNRSSLETFYKGLRAREVIHLRTCDVALAEVCIDYGLSLGHMGLVGIIRRGWRSVEYHCLHLRSIHHLDIAAVVGRYHWRRHHRRIGMISRDHIGWCCLVVRGICLNRLRRGSLMHLTHRMHCVLLIGMGLVLAHLRERLRILSLRRIVRLVGPCSLRYIIISPWQLGGSTLVFMSFLLVRLSVIDVRKIHAFDWLLDLRLRRNGLRSSSICRKK